MAPLESASRPPSLEPAARPPDPSRWWKQHAAGVACFGLGVLSIAIAAILQMRQDALFSHIPDPRITIPLWVAAALACTASVLRREGNYGLVLAGVALASAALALGWVLVLAAVAAAALVAIYVLSELF
jgi:hypothetical protein